MPSQQATTEPAPIEGVERANTVIVRGQGQKVDRGRNCYVCREFGHMTCHCRN